MLSNGASPGAAAKAVGCTPAYVSQLLGDNEFALAVAGNAAAQIEALATRDSKYDKLEDLLLAKLEDSIAFMVRPMEILKALTSINQAKRRAPGASDNLPTQVNNILVLQLPEAVKTKFKVNPNQEVIEVGERPLVTINSNLLLNRLPQANRSIKNDSSSALARADI